MERMMWTTQHLEGNGDEPYLEIFFSDGRSIEDGEELIFNYNQGASFGQEPEQVSGAYANFGQSDYTVSQGLTLHPTWLLNRWKPLLRYR